MKISIAVIPKALAVLTVASNAWGEADALADSVECHAVPFGAIAING